MSIVGLNNRKLALKLIEEVMKSKAFFEEALEADQTYVALEQKDKNFIFKLCHDVFVYYTAYSNVIRRHIQKYTKLPLAFKLIMVIALVEKRHFNSPDYAIVNVAVELSKLLKLNNLSGLVNASLKNIFEKEALSEAPKLQGEFRKFLKTFLGEQDVRDLEGVLGARPPLDITMGEGFEADFEYQQLPVNTARFHLDQSPRQMMDEMRGDFWVQDYAAANILANVATHLKGKHVLDCCAAPGGKTRQLLSYGAKVTALDKSEKRLERLDENLADFSGDCEILCQDLLNYKPDEPFDVIVLDAPCSAIGTIRKHPELQYVKNAASSQSVIALQDQMLVHVLKLLKPGGILIYCVCSMNPEEGKAKIKAFIEGQADISVMDIKGQFVKKGFYQTFPWLMKDQGSMDGFFAAYMVKA